MGTMNLRGAAAGGLLALGTLSVLSVSISSLGAWPTVACAAETTQSAGNPALVAQIASHLAQAKGVRAQFTQTQTLAAMKQPLVSTGSLLFFRDRGVIWQIDTPYKATYVITDAGVTEVNANGQRVTAHSPQGTRGVAQVSKMMRAMLGGDLSALYSQFDVEAEGSAAQWRMQLTPNQPQIAQSIKGLQMNGGDYLQSLRITLANGDITKLDFAKSAAVTEPTPAERSLLGAP
ncbi:outer membrane lipoprotein carrier protein LolA [Paraburkholderia sp. RP-4-7]|jgi:outer membrane lipoprotein-sorting protein|uniref:Outer membrane lipoprotein carrier protein LolA n=1 Tax=Paraburkholderia polaris TaxID=2728848 RepID=A0A848IFJ8_9BURK|nr:outer membrane lipoprotein carrier protein LolA [Paraburkholderia polaris]NMM00401.1 outer membrane lipoprotein carrier protein LolA [Paraburkholderia polaris]